MFQWLVATRACKNVNRVKNVASLNLFSMVVLVLLVFQSSGFAVASNSPPTWTVPVQQTSDDGYALLAWQSVVDESPGLFKITETFKEKVMFHYTESTDLRAWRVEPGEYEFFIQSCVKNDTGAPDCGNPSETLELLVADALRTNFYLVFQGAP